MLNFDIFFPSKICRGCQVCVTCNSNSFHSFILKLCIMDCSHIEDVHLLFSAHLINFFTFLTGVELGHFSIRNVLGVSGLCNL